MIFIVFDIEIIFLFPWAIVFRVARRRSASVAIVIFAAAVFESFVYLISNGALDWGPIKQLPPHRRGRPGPHRRPRTIRRVGLEGREPESTPSTAPEEAA